MNVADPHSLNTACRTRTPTGRAMLGAYVWAVMGKVHGPVVPKQPDVLVAALADIEAKGIIH